MTDTLYFCGRSWTIAAGLSAALLFAAPPRMGLAQSRETPTPGAWWTQSHSPDDATYCATAAAWNQAMDAEQRAERELTADGLTSVLQGSELARERQAVEALQARGQSQLAEGIRMWKIASDSGDDAVVFATSTRLVGYAQPGESEVNGSVWVEDSQSAYRLVRTDDGWRVSDQHVFEDNRHAADLAAMSALVEPYRRLLSDALGAFSTGDFDNLDQILDGEALVDYRQRVQAAAESGRLQRISIDGTFLVLDASNDMALAVFSGTVSSADIDPATGASGRVFVQPWAVAHRLERYGGDWKIVLELQSSTRTDPDGSVHIGGCGQS